MKESDNHAQTIERVLKSIAVHEDEKSVSTARELLLGELKRVEESEAAFHRLVASATCVVRITFGCVFSTERLVDQEGASPSPHPVSPVKQMATAQRAPIGWGGGRCWYGKNCWICIEYECRA